ncbi:ExeM/NucH family extracellular endonuclease [Duganella sp. LX20W]|uniref:ExeM/NucH family extracellular endonuclease n=1 Tax=Rugamonas brunnea TaxID=2758569 RepID=A0A7W2IB68_9BURK|nr:ExeM/NucH family extracellular endonuclease [Rugamonas brunnea]MBA5637151.1 ExeM/NucH family extracellular endonuclease [Rugamonas brunnea]
MTYYASPDRAGAAATLGRRTMLAVLLASLGLPALASDVVISQVYGGGGNSGATYKNDFIELFNRSAGPVSLNGWSVQYASAASAAGTAWQVTPLPNVTLQPGQYLLVQEAMGAGGTTALPTPQATGTIAMSGTAGKVALAASTTAFNVSNPSGGALRDLLGYGNTVNGYEGAPGPGLSNTTAAQRGDDGCADTDNNQADFSTAAPAPRNSASALRVCGAPVVLPIVPTCPATLALAAGSGGGAMLSATDADGIVNSAAISSAAVPGISLAGFTAAGAVGGNASVSLNVDGTVPVGSYPVAIRFGNDQGQNASCTVNVSVTALAAVTHSIPQIQGAGATSPYAGTVQTTEGVLTLKVGTGFFIQDEAGDGDPTTSDGIFVYTGSTTNSAQPGDKVRVTGSVVEYTPTGASRSVTEFKDVTAVVVQSSGHSITPANIDLPNADLGQFEGMLVRFVHPLTVSQSAFLGTRGELSLSSGRLEVPTNHYPPRTAGALALAAANARNLIVLDDGLSITPPTIPYLGQDGTIRAGDTVADLTGVIDFGAKGGGGAAYKLQPTVAPQFSRDNPRTTAPSIAAGNVRVASANVLNFFTTFTNGSNVEGASNQGCSLGASVSKANCRGADNMAEFVRQRDKIVGELKAIDADVYGLMEIQNNGETTVSYLVNALNAAIGAPVYAVVPKPADTGTDAIRVAMIYKPSRLALVGGALSDSDSINNRPPMAQTFRAANGGKFSLVVNHFKSKGGCPAGTGPDTDQGDSQGCWNATRIQQANRLLGTFVPQVVAAAGDPDVLLIGDFNSHGFEDPINAITATGFVNQLERYVRPNGMPYSFIFDSQSGYLDHALASPKLHGQVAGATEWHINADEPSVIDYNLDGKQQDLYTAQPYRASDHDPVVISLNLQPSFVDVSASVRAVGSGLVYNRATGKYGSTFTVTNVGTAALSGPLQVQFDGLPVGVTLVNATGLHDGAPYITVDAAALAAGASVSFPLSFSKTGSANIGYTAKVYSGTF